ncbi:MAG: BolA family transcriptional regulator [Candidatus Omnitrophica bacterium]|nr:BolA family transcriptional regulator [Candidatus Omnitrophota bacterium]
MLPEEVKAMILAAMPDAQVSVVDMRGTGDHFDIEIISRAFAGKTLIEQHQMVFKTLAGEMDRRIHAVQLKTRIPKE